jgi:CRISPR-associated endonuclease/helicase Cas3
MRNEQEFENWFEKATERKPYPFQSRFACDPTLPGLVDVPTGMGKTSMAVMGWLWRRRFHPDTAVRKRTPRRLVYCLPMRVLVEQTVSEAKRWIDELKEHYPQEMTQPLNVYILMGGEIDNDWDAYPEADAILIGTQDQLLSRALNRGYAMSRYRCYLVTYDIADAKRLRRVFKTMERVRRTSPVFGVSMRSAGHRSGTDEGGLDGNHPSD